MRMRPVLVGPFVLALAIKLLLDPPTSGSQCQRPGPAWSKSRYTSLRCRGARCWQGRVRFERGGVYSNRFPLDQPGEAQTLKHPREFRPIGVQIDQSPRPRYRGVIPAPPLSAPVRETRQLVCEHIAATVAHFKAKIPLPNCGGDLKIIAAIEDPPVIDKILSHLGLPTRADGAARSEFERAARKGTFRAPATGSPPEPTQAKAQISLIALTNRSDD